MCKALHVKCNCKRGGNDAPKTYLIDFIIRSWEQICNMAITEGVVQVSPVGKPTVELIHNTKGLTSTTIYGGEIVEIGSIERMPPSYPSKDLLNSLTLKRLTHIVFAFEWTDDFPKSKGELVSFIGENWTKMVEQSPFSEPQGGDAIETVVPPKFEASLEQLEPEPETEEASVSFKPFVIEIGFDFRESDIDAEYVIELAEMLPMEYEVLSPLTTVRELIGYINMKCNLVEREYMLQFVGKGFAFPMPHGDTLGQYNKGNDPSILCEIVLKQMPSVKVIVFNKDDTKEFYFDPRVSTIGDIKNAICFETGNELQSFHLTFEGKPLPHYRRLAEYILEGEFKLSIVASGLAGGAVKKGFLKPKKTTKNTVADKSVYDTAYNTAIAIDTANSFVLKGYLENMSNEKLVALSDYLTTDRSIYATKLKNIHTFFPSFEELQMVINKATVATETLQSLVSDDIDKTFGLDDAKEAVEGVKGLLREIIAVKSYQSRGGYTGNASMDADL